jgi:hypothetical protein
MSWLMYWLARVLAAFVAFLAAGVVTSNPSPAAPSPAVTPVAAATASPQPTPGPGVTVTGPPSPVPPLPGEFPCTWPRTTPIGISFVCIHAHLHSSVPVSLYGAPQVDAAVIATFAAGQSLQILGFVEDGGQWDYFNAAGIDGWARCIDATCSISR